MHLLNYLYQRKIIATEPIDLGRVAEEYLTHCEGRGQPQEVERERNIAAYERHLEQASKHHPVTGNFQPSFELAKLVTPKFVVDNIITDVAR